MNWFASFYRAWPLDQAERSQVIEELSAHLEEPYQTLIRSGMPGPEAAQRAGFGR